MIAIKCDQENSRADKLSEELNIPLETDLTERPDLLLGWHEEKLTLFPNNSGPVFIDFVAGKTRSPATVRRW